MSETDSFIEEVTEEVRRDRLFGYYRRYGWIAILIVVLIVAGAAWNEWRGAQDAAAAQALGDEIIEGLQAQNQGARTEAITAVRSDNPGGQAMLDLLAAAELNASALPDEATARLRALAENPDVPEIYRQIAGFKLILVQARSLPAAERRRELEAFAIPGNPFRPLAEEQLALIDVEQGDPASAIKRLQALIEDAEAGRDLQQRAGQVIVALGGEPVLPEAGQAGQ